MPALMAAALMPATAATKSYVTATVIRLAVAVSGTVGRVGGIGDTAAEYRG
jgi:hypothetical protein